MVNERQWYFDFLCGSISGFANCLSGYIFDTLKVKIQINPHMSMGKYIKQLSKKGKLLTLFDGMYYPLTTVPLVNAVVFGSYEFYKKMLAKEDLSFIDGIQNGAFAGLVNTVIVSPVELVKCRMQLDDKKFRNSRECLRFILKNQGLRGVFKGMFATAVREIPAYSAQFATYELLKDYVTSPSKRNLTFTESLIVGGFAGINCWIFSYPQDIIKTKLQVSPPSMHPKNFIIPDGGFFHCSMLIYKENGIKGFWFGISPCLVRAVVANAFGIAFYEKSQQFIGTFQSDN